MSIELPQPIKHETITKASTTSTPMVCVLILRFTTRVQLQLSTVSVERTVRQHLEQRLGSSRSPNNAYRDSGIRKSVRVRQLLQIARRIFGHAATAPDMASSRDSSNTSLRSIVLTIALVSSLCGKSPEMSGALGAAAVSGNFVPVGGAVGAGGVASVAAASGGGGAAAGSGNTQRGGSGAGGTIGSSAGGGEWWCRPPGWHGRRA
ncbi:MAG TPA: hypothetical protein VJV78_39250 [Polyangiales bacterium]|nr:hypothetical protein [Polyangiales bacterium]